MAALQAQTTTSGTTDLGGNGTDLRVKALPCAGFKAPCDLNHKEHKGKALLNALCVPNSNLSTCINSHVYRAFMLKTLPLIQEAVRE